MLSHGARNNLLVPDRITVTDLYRINGMFEQIKAMMVEIYYLSLSLFLKKLQDTDYGNLSYRWISESKDCEELADKIRLESTHLAAGYESLKGMVKEFRSLPLGNDFVSDMTGIEAGINKVSKIISLLS